MPSTHNKDLKLEVTSHQMSDVLLFSARLGKFGGTMQRLCLWLGNLPNGCNPTFLFAGVRGHRSGAIIRTFAKSSVQLDEITAPRLNSTMAMRVKSGFVLFMRLWSGRYKVVLPVFSDSEITAFFIVKVVNFLKRDFIRTVFHRAGPPIPIRRIGTWRGVFLKILLKFIYSRCDRMIAISHELKKQLMNGYNVPEGRITLIPISVTCKATDSSILYGEKEDFFTFGIVSRLTPEKSIDHALRAISDLENEKRLVKLMIFGSGADSANLKDLTKQLMLQDIVHFHGWIDDPRQAMSSIECLILPSKYEGTPRSILEAGCHGVPTIASNVGGVSEVIEHGKTGWLYTYGNIDELTHLMLEASENRHRCQTVGRALQRIVHKERNPGSEILSLIDCLSFPGQSIR